MNMNTIVKMNMKGNIKKVCFQFYITNSFQKGHHLFDKVIPALFDHLGLLSEGFAAVVHDVRDLVGWR